MMRRLVLLLSFLIFTHTVVLANEDLIIYKVENRGGSISAETIAVALAKSGYEVAKNQDMNGPYKKQFGKSGFMSYNLMSIYHPKIANEMVSKYPKSGIFVPFSVATYQRKGEEYFYIALLSAISQAKILELHDPLLEELEALNRKTIRAILPTAKEVKLSYEPTKSDKKLYTKYSFDIDDEDALDAYDEMSFIISEEMKPSGFVRANYLDFNEKLKESNNRDYIFYDSLSLCKLKIIYELSKTKPEAGAFAPCTMIIYHKKGSNSTNIVTLNINNLISTLALKDSSLIAMLKSAQDTMGSIVEEASE